MKTQQGLKKGGIISRNSYCFMSAIIAAIIMLFVYAVWQFFPFGENIILRMDLYHQYAPLFAELYERVFGGHTLLYSFTSGLGSSFLGNYFNYLSSPSMLFVLIFGHSNVPEAVAAMVLVKAAASAYTFSYFLGKITKKSSTITAAFGILYAFSGYFIAYYWNVMWLDAMVMFPIVMLGIYYIIEQGRTLPYVLSLAYVMITNYYMAYMTCLLSVIFFLYFYFSKHSLGAKMNNDVIIKNKYKHSVAVGIFNSTFIQRGLAFAAASIGAALIAAFSLLPVYFILQHSSATTSTFPTEFSTYFSIFDFLANHLSGVEPTIRSSGDTVYPNICCGIITLILAPLFLFSKKFNIKEKIASALVMAVFFFSFNIKTLNFIWHGFHFPNDLPYRFSFAYSFFLLFIAYRVFVEIDHISNKAILCSSIGVGMFAVMTEKITSANVDLTVIWVSVIFAAVYAVVLSLVKNPKYSKPAISILLLTCICAEVLIAGTGNYKVTQTKTAYTSSYEDTETVINRIKETEGEDGFYRMELATLLTRMDNSWFFYNGVSTFSSMAYKSVANLQDKLGLYGNRINSYTYNCQTGLYNSMMSLKYIVDNHSYVATDSYTPNMAGNFLYKETDTYNDMTVYENKYWLPVAFGVGNDTDTAWQYDESNPFEVQNDFFANASGVSGILVPLEGKVDNIQNIEDISDSMVNNGTINLAKKDTSNTVSDASFSYAVNTAQNVYVYLDCRDVHTASIQVTSGSGLDSAFATPDKDAAVPEVDSTETQSEDASTADNTNASSGFYSSSDTGDIVFSYTNDDVDDNGYIVDLGPVAAGSKIVIDYGLKEESLTGNMKMFVYGMDQKKFTDAYDAINANGTLNVTENKENYISGTINLAADKMLYTSIPYDEGWSVKVDGEKIDSENIVKVGDALMGVKMASGEHTVELKYTPKGLVVGIVASVAAIAMLIFLLILKKKKALVFGEAYKRDYLELGRWRDYGAEQEQEEQRIVEEQELTELIEEAAEDKMFNAEDDDAWQSALTDAESFVRTTSKESEAESAQENPITEDSNENAAESDDEDGKKKMKNDNEVDNMPENGDDNDIEFDDFQEEYQEPLTTSEELDEFEKATSILDRERMPRSDFSEQKTEKKTEKKKKINTAIFIVIVILVIAAAVAIMVYAINHNKANADDGVSVLPSVSDDVSESEDSDSTAIVLTTVATTGVQTTATTTVPTTAATTVATTAKTTVATTAATTAAPTTAATTVPAYDGAYVEYTVKAGDNFYSILRDHGVTDTPANVQKMCSLNGISVNSGLSVGQTLRVPTDLG